MQATQPETASKKEFTSNVTTGAWKLICINNLLTVSLIRKITTKIVILFYFL